MLASCWQVPEPSSKDPHDFGSAATPVKTEDVMYQPPLPRNSEEARVLMELAPPPPEHAAISTSPSWQTPTAAGWLYSSRKLPHPS